MPRLRIAPTLIPSLPRPSGVDHAIRLDLEADGRWEPLLRGHPVVYARGVRSEAWGVTEPRGLVGASLSLEADGMLRVVSRRVTVGDGHTDAIVVSTYAGRGLFETVELAPAEQRVGGATEIDLPASLAAELWESLGQPARRTIEATARFPFIEGRADPSVVRWKGKWLFIATDEHFAKHPKESGLLLRVAEDIDELPAAADRRILGPNGRLRGCFWAPELHEIGGRLRCLFAPSVDSPEWTHVECWMMTLADDGDPADAAAWSAPVPVRKRGGRPLQLDDEHLGISLDMTFFAAGGRSYLAWSQRFTHPHLGDAELWIAEIDEAEPWRLLTDPVVIASPEYSWELDGANVVEGPYVIVRNSLVYLTYSGAAVGSAYAVGVLTASEDADLLDRTSWTKLGHPILETEASEGQWGPGHSMFTKDEAGDDLLIYHALASPDGRVRDAGIRPVQFGVGGRLSLDLTDERQHIS